VLSIAAAMVFIVILVGRASHSRRWYPMVLAVLIAVSPFILSLLLGATLPNRALQALPLLAASRRLLLVQVLPKWRLLPAALVACASLLAIWNGDANTQLFLAEYLTFEEDKTVAAAILSGWPRPDGTAVMCRSYQLVHARSGSPTAVRWMRHLEDRSSAGRVALARLRSCRRWVTRFDLRTSKREQRPCRESRLCLPGQP
jgi:hypothetical protein